MSSGNSGSWNHYRTTTSWSLFNGTTTTYYYFTACGAGTWAYIDLSVIADVDGYAINDLLELVIEYLSENGYSYDETIYNVTGCLFVTELSTFAIADGITAALEYAINVYTTDTYGIIGMYSIAVTLTSFGNTAEDSVSNVVNISMEVVQNAESEYYYSVTDVKYYVDDTEYSSAATIDYGSNMLEFNGNKYLKAGENTITVSAATKLYEVEYVYVNGTEVTAPNDGENTFSVSGTIAIKVELTIEIV